MKTVIRYYNTECPLGSGTFPEKDGTEIVVNFGKKLPCEEIGGKEAWGYVQYFQPLLQGEVVAYELTPGTGEGYVEVFDNGVAYSTEPIVVKEGE